MNAKQRQLRHTDYLEHMLESVRLARRYSNGLTKAEFVEDKKTQQAVILNLLVIGEAATQIASGHPDFAEQHPEFPWKQMRGMRNRMTHGYFEINLDIVWDTVRQSLPALEQQIIQIQEQLERQSQGNADRSNGFEP
jgi:uncharacterized protein with HEPN domain